MSPAPCCCRYIALPVKEAVTSISVCLFKQKVHHAIHPGLQDPGCVVSEDKLWVCMGWY